jgi:hypothetical protein
VNLGARYVGEEARTLFNMAQRNVIFVMPLANILQKDSPALCVRDMGYLNLRGKVRRVFNVKGREKQKIIIFPVPIAMDMELLKKQPKEELQGIWAK